MSVIANGLKFGNISIDKKYVMTRSEMETLGDATEYPDIFPIWCTDDNSLYIFYKTTDGTPNIKNFNQLTNTGVQMVVYPTIDEATNELSWSLKEVNGEVPDPVILKGNDGDSAYDVWLSLGNTGTKEDFLQSLVPDLNNLTEAQITNLKNVLGITQIENTISDMNDSLNTLLG